MLPFPSDAGWPAEICARYRTLRLFPSQHFGAGFRLDLCSWPHYGGQLPGKTTESSVYVKCGRESVAFQMLFDCNFYHPCPLAMLAGNV